MSKIKLLELVICIFIVSIFLITIIKEVNIVLDKFLFLKDTINNSYVEYFDAY